jgi:hypothetical protein
MNVMRGIIPLALISGMMSTCNTQAAPMLEVKVFDDGVQVGATVTSGAGSIAYIGSDANFTDIQVSGQGNPILPEPDLSSIVIEASAANFTGGPHVLEVDVTQTGLTFAGGQMSITGTVNGLVGAPGPTTLNTFVEGLNVDTELFPASGSAAAFGPVSLLVGAVTSDEQQYLTTFTAGMQSSSASMQFVGAEAVPEPCTLALLGGSLVVLWAARRNRRRAGPPHSARCATAI